MNKKLSRLLGTCVACGGLAGCVFGMYGVFTRLSSDDFLSMSNTIIKICFGVMVLLIDVICIVELLRPAGIRNIAENGVRVRGRVVSCTMTIQRTAAEMPEEDRPARFVFTAAYDADGRELTRELSPTCITSKNDLFPISTEEGAAIPLKYLKDRPKSVIIDSEKLINGKLTELRSAALLFIMIPCVITAGFILAIKML